MDRMIGLKPLRSRLLELPPELREAIYEYIALAENPLVTFRLDSYQQDTYQQATQPALTRVSVQVRRESLPIYYSCNEFILHAEGTKAADARRWLICNAHYLPRIRHLSLWVRYVTLTNDRSSSQGALSLRLSKDTATGCWIVEDKWKWITVVRKPAGLEGDAKFMIATLRRMLVNDSTSYLSAEGFVYLLADLRMEYAKEKMS